MFAIFNLTDAYFKIWVTEESAQRLCFIVPQGKFIMTVLGQGWNNSSDYLNIHTQSLISGIERALKLIDDGLAQ